MAFRFSLEPVLRLRAGYERLEKLRLLALAGVLARIRDEIAVVAREEAVLRQTRRESLSRGTTAAEIQLGTFADMARAKRNRELAERAVAIQRQHAKQMRVYQLARQKREILENLRERRRQEYERELARKQQQELDETYLLRLRMHD